MKLIAQLGGQMETGVRLVPLPGKTLPRVLRVPAAPKLPTFERESPPTPATIERDERWELVTWKRGTVSAEWWHSMGFELGDGWSPKTRDQELTWGIYRRTA